MAENMNISVTRVTQVENTCCLRVQLPTSTVNKKQVNEWQVILNALASSVYARTDYSQGFTYTFPFALAKGTGFPYCLPMQFEASGTSTDAEVVGVLG